MDIAVGNAMVLDEYVYTKSLFKTYSTAIKIYVHLNFYYEIRNPETTILCKYYILYDIILIIHITLLPLYSQTYFPSLLISLDTLFKLSCIITSILFVSSNVCEMIDVH